MNRWRRNGFTIIDLAVSVMIISVLIALLLPSVQNARESARRIQCQNNLRQIGLALNNYHDVFETLPPGVVNPTGPIRARQSGYHMGWLVQILPQLDDAALYRQVDFGESIYSQKNAQVHNASPEVLQCSSSLMAAGQSAYAGSYNDIEAPIDVDNNGVLFLNSSVTWDDMIDGRSNTLYASEMDAIGAMAVSGVPTSWASGTLASLRNASKPMTVGQVVAMVNAMPATQPAGATLLRVGTFGSPHNASMNILLGDGSVRYIRDDLDRGILQRLANRRDSAIVGDF